MTVSMYEPRTMRRAIAIMPPVHTFLSDLLITERNTHPTETIDVDIRKGARQVAPIVHPKRGGKVIRDEGFETKSYKAPLVEPVTVTDADKLSQRMPGESLYGGKKPADRAQERVGRDLARMDEMITRLEELMLANLIFTGTVPLKGDGVDVVMAFGFTNDETLTGGDLWTDGANSDPIAKIEEKVELIKKSGFKQATDVLMEPTAANAFINHPKVKDQMDTRRINLGEIEPKKLPNGATYIGTLKKSGLDLYSYQDYYLDEITDPDNPVEKELVPVGKVAIVSTNANFSLEYGAVTLLDKETEQWTTYEDTRVPDSWTEKKPDRRMLSVTSRPLVIPHEVNAWATMDVL